MVNFYYVNFTLINYYLKNLRRLKMETKNWLGEKKTNSKMKDLNLAKLIITINVYGAKFLIKRQCARLNKNWIKKKSRPNSAYKKQILNNGTTKLKVKEGKRYAMLTLIKKSWNDNIKTEKGILWRKNKEGQCHNYKEVNSRSRHKNLKLMYLITMSKKQ